MRPTSIRAANLAPVLLIMGGCTNDGVGHAPDAPVIATVSPVRNPHHVLGAIIRVQLQGAESVAVRFTSTEAGGDEVTPRVGVVGDSAIVPVLGLRAATQYELCVVASGAGGTTVSAPIAFTTDTLPSDLPAYPATGDDPSPGFVVFGAESYGLVIDNTGRVVWYRRFPTGVGLNFAALPNGRYATRIPALDPTDGGRWIEVDALGNETRSLACSAGFRVRPHDLIVEPDRNYWLLCDETRRSPSGPAQRSTGRMAMRSTWTPTETSSSRFAISARSRRSRAFAPGGVLLLDNVGDPNQSRAERYVLDERTMTARLVQSYGSTPSVVTLIGGSVQPLPAGRTLVSFGTAGRVEEFDASGRVVWRIDGHAGYVFGAQRIRSLYEPGVGLTR